MKNKKLSMSNLEKEMASVENDALSEEQNNASSNYNSLDNEFKEIVSQIPYPETDRYTIGRDYDDRERLIGEKAANEPYWIKRDKVEKYCNNGSLYSGHLNLNNINYYIMDSRMLDTKIIKVDSEEVWLINVDDRTYADFVKWWRYPSENPNVMYSRNITMNSRKVSAVDIVLDKGNELFSEISDAYLRNALIRNKQKKGVQSIIQTIQKKQDNIRSLPKEITFVVQGCAGAGKTMVLLHRLRYLLYNKDIENNEYIFLVPGSSFKEFIDEISTNFKISKRNILSYQEYYQSFFNKTNDVKSAEVSELVFDADYLKRIYSKEFIQEAYRTLFENFLKQLDLLIGFCDSKLNELIEFEKLSLEDSIEKAQRKAVEESNFISKNIQKFTVNKIGDNYENIGPFIDEIYEAYLSRKKEYDSSIDPNVEVDVSPDDERILGDKSLNEIQKQIDAENLAIEKASIFTAMAHKSKLRQLQVRYENTYEELVKKLAEVDKQRYIEQSSKLFFLYEGATLEEVEKIINSLKSILSKTNDVISKTRDDLENLYDHFGEKYTGEIDSLNKLIMLSSELTNGNCDYIDNLSPSFSFFEDNMRMGTNLLKSFNQYVTSQKDKDTIKNDLVFFAERSGHQVYAYLNTLLFNACKKKTSIEFDIKICDLYKHYWYLALYCSYLTRPAKDLSRRYIFIDEAQDLSVSELELIYKVNRTAEVPILNLFGDTNQMITAHGISDWSDLKMIPEIYTLEENFRNTNQVVEYCNRKLPIQMLKIGVDMEEVSEYKSLNDAVASTKSIQKNAVFIVKDDYSVYDLKILLEDTRISNFEIYTVKSAKGLEFKEVFVFDFNMTTNEKYISYTRALAKLNVIHELPEKSNGKMSLIVQGENDDV